MYEGDISKNKTLIWFKVSFIIFFWNTLDQKWMSNAELESESLLTLSLTKRIRNVGSNLHLWRSSKVDLFTFYNTRGGREKNVPFQLIKFRVYDHSAGFFIAVMWTDHIICSVPNILYTGFMQCAAKFYDTYHGRGKMKAVITICRIKNRITLFLHHGLFLYAKLFPCFPIAQQVKQMCTLWD